MCLALMFLYAWTFLSSLFFDFIGKSLIIFKIGLYVFLWEYFKHDHSFVKIDS